MVDLVVIGVGFPDIVQTIEDIIEQSPELNFLGFLDDKEEMCGQSVVGYPVIGSIDWLEKQDGVRFFNSIGRSMDTRANVNRRVEAFGGTPYSLIHPTVNTRYTQLGEGVLLSKNVYIEPRTHIGNHTIVMPNVTIGHDTIVEDNCFLASGCHLGGNVVVEEKCLIGAGSSLHPRVRVASGARVGVNSAVMRNVKSGRTVFSRPAESI